MNRLSPLLLFYLVYFHFDNCGSARESDEELVTELWIPSNETSEVR